jgi:ribosomal protein S18 acetylase RimI-like enzyme
MRPAHVRDLPGAYRVCRLTGAAGGDATGLHLDPDLLGHVWVGPYLLHPDAVALVVHDAAGVAGYCVGAPDTAAFEDWLEAHWLPGLRADHPRGTAATVADRALVERIHDWPRTDAAVLRRFPAHLHIDLLPRLQGQGWGRRLAEAVLDELARGGATGIHLGVDPANPGAGAFYEQLGFTRLGHVDDGAAHWFGMTLPRTG